MIGVKLGGGDSPVTGVNLGGADSPAIRVNLDGGDSPAIRVNLGAGGNSRPVGRLNRRTRLGQHRFIERRRRLELIVERRQHSAALQVSLENIILLRIGHRPGS